MLVKDIIQRVQSLYSKGVQSDDTRLSNRHIYNKMVTVRSKLLSQEAKKKQKISQWNYQTLTCIELITVPAHECPCLPTLGCEVLRSKYELPEPLTGLNGSLIEWVRTIEKSIKIDYISINALNAQKGNKYTAKKLQYFIENGYLYISTPSKLKVVSLKAVFEDPIVADTFENYCDTCEDCNKCVDYLEENFPIDNDMLDTLVELTVQEVVILFQQNRENITNDSRDNLKEQSK